jgi:hypothetical protein
LKALRVSAEAAVLAKKDAKHDVDHNCLCQSTYLFLTIMAKGPKPLTILAQRFELIH